MCNRCNSKEDTSLHACPYALEINNDYDFVCDCCSDCEHECCMDI